MISLERYCRKEKPPRVGRRNSDMVCLDTDILIGLLRGDKAAVRMVEKLERIKKPLKTTIITGYELLKGASISSKPEENLQRSRHLLSGLDIIPFDEGACEEPSRIYGELKLSGKMIGEFDILIASIVINHDQGLVSGDDHFRMIRGLELEKW